MFLGSHSFMKTDIHSAVLCSTEIQDCQKNSGSGAAGEKAEFEQVSQSVE